MMSEEVLYQLKTVPLHEWSHLLLEASSLAELKSALRNVSRLRYTCLSVSQKYLALGSNTGAVYIYSREKLKQLQIVFGDQETAHVTQIALSPNNSNVSFSTIHGHVIVMELNIERRSKPERLRLTTDHVGRNVTCLHWDKTSTRLFMADNMGKVTVALIPSSKTQNFFVQPSEVIVVLESAVVQLDWSDDELLVSTMTRCYLCNTGRHEYWPIGKKLREGSFGACFYQQPFTSSAVYCARPGSRIWEADFVGNVLSTHQFKQLLAIPPLPVISISDEEVEFSSLEDKDYTPQAVNFSKLKMIDGHFLLTWTEEAIFIFNPVNVKVILWSRIQDIQDIVCYKSDLYVFFQNTDVRKLQFLSIQKCVAFLVSKQCWKLSAELCSLFGSSLINSHHVLHSRTIQQILGKLQSYEYRDLYSRLERILLDQHIDDVSESENELSDSVSVKDKSDSSSIDTWNSGIGHTSIMTDNSSSNSGVVSELETMTDDAKDESNSMREMMSERLVTKTAVDRNSDIIDVQNPRNVDVSRSFPSKVDKESFRTDFRESKGVMVDAYTDHSSRTITNFSNSNFVLVDEITAASKFIPPSCQKRRVSPETFQLVDYVGISGTEDVSKHETTPNVMSLEIKDVDHETEVVIDNDEKQKESMKCLDIKNMSENGTLSATVVTDQKPYVSPSTTPPVNKFHRVKVTAVDIDSPTEVRIKVKRKTGKRRMAHSTVSLKEYERKAVHDPRSEERDGIMETIEHEAFVTDRQMKIAGSFPDSSILAGSRIEPSHPVEVVRCQPMLQSSPGSYAQNLFGDSYHSDISVSPSPKVALLIMKDRLQSKITNTKRLLLKTISDRNSPTSEDKFAPKQDGEEQLEKQTSEHADKTARILLDTTELVKCTEHARKKLNDLSVVLDSKGSRLVLQQWVVCLNTMLQRLHTEIKKQQMSFKHSTDTLCYDDRSKGVDGSHEDKREITPKNIPEVSSNFYTSEDMNVAFKLSNDGVQSDNMPDNTGVFFDWRNICHTKDPFHLNPITHSSASELAMCCFDISCHGDILKFVNPTHVEHGNLCEPDDGVTSSIFDCDNSVHSDLDINKLGNLSMQANNNQDYNFTSMPDMAQCESELEILRTSADFIPRCEKIISVKAPNGSECDKSGHFNEEELAIFIRCHYHLLNMKNILQSIYSSDSPSYPLWCALLNCSQDITCGDYVSKKLDEKDVNSVLDYLHSGSTVREEVLRAYIAGLFKLNPTKTVDYCSETRLIHPLDILFLCRLYTKPVQIFFYKYMMDKLELTAEQNRSQVIKSLCDNSLVRRTMMSILLARVDSSAQLKSPLGKPGYDSHKVKWPEQQYIDQVIDIFWEKEADLLLKMCTEQSYWNGCLNLYQKLEKNEERVELILQLGDLSLFGLDCKYGYLPSSLKDWQHLIAVFSSLYSENTNICLSEKESSDWLQAVTWEKMATILVKYLGPLTAVKLLEDAKVPDGSLSTMFYRMCLTGSQLHMQQREVVHHMLEKIDTYLWAKKPTLMGPQLYYAASEEKRSQTDDKDDPAFKYLLTFLNHESLLNTGQTAEDPDCHWGTQTRINSLCPCCNIPVTEHVSHIEPGAIVFQCGHSYHKHCVPDRECLLCQSSADQTPFV